MKVKRIFGKCRYILFERQVPAGGGGTSSRPCSIVPLSRSLPPDPSCHQFRSLSVLSVPVCCCLSVSCAGAWPPHSSTVPRPSLVDHPHLTVICNQDHQDIYPSLPTIRRQIVSCTYPVEQLPDSIPTCIPSFQFTRVQVCAFLILLSLCQSSPSQLHHNPALLPDTIFIESSCVTVGSPASQPIQPRFGPVVSGLPLTDATFCNNLDQPWTNKLFYCFRCRLWSFVPCVWVHSVLSRKMVFSFCW